MASFSAAQPPQTEAPEAAPNLGDSLRRVFAEMPDLDEQAQELRRMMRSSDDDLMALGLRRDKLHRRNLQPFADT